MEYEPAKTGKRSPKNIHEKNGENITIDEMIVKQWIPISRKINSLKNK